MAILEMPGKTLTLCIILLCVPLLLFSIRWDIWGVEVQVWCPGLSVRHLYHPCVLFPRQNLAFTTGSRTGFIWGVLDKILLQNSTVTEGEVDVSHDTLSLMQIMTFRKADLLSFHIHVCAGNCLVLAVEMISGRLKYCYRVNWSVVLESSCICRHNNKMLYNLQCSSGVSVG